MVFSSQDWKPIGLMSVVIAVIASSAMVASGGASGELPGTHADAQVLASIRGAQVGFSCTNGAACTATQACPAAQAGVCPIPAANCVAGAVGGVANTCSGAVNQTCVAGGSAVQCVAAPVQTCCNLTNSCAQGRAGCDCSGAIIGGPVAIGTRTVC